MTIKQINIIGLLVLIIFVSSCSKTEITPLAPVQDTIPSVTICSKTWMTRNLDVVTFRNGDTIPQVSGNFNWGAMVVQSPRPAWCYAHDDPANDSVYGKLYNWVAITDPRGLAPEGWHVATYAEWKTLIDSCLGGTTAAARALKEAGYAHWEDHGHPYYTGTNSSGLNCLPGGYRLGGIGFLNPLGRTGNWWCGTGDENGNPCMMWLSDIIDEVQFSASGLGNTGVSVRCVKD